MLPKKAKSPDDFQTPVRALNPLYPYIPKDKIIWEPAMGKGNLTNELITQGYEVIGTDIKQGVDFLEWEPERYDIIVTNPPYSIKTKWLERCYELNKPFAMLLPLTALESQARQKLYKQYGMSMILFNKRINYETPNKVKNSSAWFASAWFCWGLELPNQLNFVDY